MQKKHFVFLCALVALLAINMPVIFAEEEAVERPAAPQALTAKDFVAEAKSKISQISIEEAKAIFDAGGTLFLDVREPDEFKSGHIPGAINIPRGMVEFEIEKKIANKNKNIVVYCKSGGCAALATYVLNQMGYKKAVNLKGGFQAWAMEGYPVE